MKTKTLPYQQTRLNQFILIVKEEKVEEPKTFEFEGAVFKEVY